MVQFNLLPDVKLEYLKAERTKRVVLSVSVLVAAASLALMVLLFGVTQLQKKHLSDLSKDIAKESSEIEGKQDLNRILTVQNQLNSLTALHNAKPAAAQLFDYLGEVVPDKVNAENLAVDFNQHTLTFTGTADSLTTVNKFVDTLKFTNYTVEGQKGKKPAFSNVVLSGFGLASKAADYTVTLAYDPTIFDITQKVSLDVPNLITTRSEVDKPSELFVLPTNTKTGQ